MSLSRHHQLVPRYHSSVWDLDFHDKFFDRPWPRPSSALDRYDLNRDLWPRYRPLRSYDWLDLDAEHNRFSREFERHSGWSSVKDNKDKYEVSVDVKDFKPSEVSVTCDDGSVKIHGKHEERLPNKFVSREFQRKYLLPKEVDSDLVYCDWKPSGILNINAPKKTRPYYSWRNERRIPITTGWESYGSRS